MYAILHSFSIELTISDYNKHSEHSPMWKVCIGSGQITHNPCIQALIIQTLQASIHMYALTLCIIYMAIAKAYLIHLFTVSSNLGPTLKKMYHRYWQMFRSNNTMHCKKLTNIDISVHNCISEWISLQS